MDIAGMVLGDRSGGEIGFEGKIKLAAGKNGYSRFDEIAFAFRFFTTVLVYINGMRDLFREQVAEQGHSHLFNGQCLDAQHQ
jgi:hypothetical protein